MRETTSIPQTSRRSLARATVFSVGARVPAIFTRRAVSRIPHGAQDRPGNEESVRPVLYLTYDDGPTQQHTEQLAEVLAEFDASATFFVNTTKISGQIAEHGDALSRLVQAGHEIGTHGHSHTDPWKTTAAETLADLNNSLEVLATRGIKPRWFRPPYGHLRPCHSRTLRAHKLRVALWDVMPCDFLGTISADDVAGSTIRLASPGSIVALHDNDCVAATGVTLDATRQILQHYSDEGWSFSSLSGS